MPTLKTILLLVVFLQFSYFLRSYQVAKWPLDTKSSIPIIKPTSLVFLLLVLRSSIPRFIQLQYQEFLLLSYLSLVFLLSSTVARYSYVFWTPLYTSYFPSFSSIHSVFSFFFLYTLRIFFLFPLYTLYFLSFSSIRAVCFL